MSRIGRAFERRFRELLGEAGARQIDNGVRWLLARADELARETGTTRSHALAEMNISLAEKLHRLRAKRSSPPREGTRPTVCQPREGTWSTACRPRGGTRPTVFCDAGLGGLARWLRASGCEALWVQDISDADLVARAEEINAVIITTDSFLLDRRPIVHGRVRAVWVPPTLTIFEQLRLVRAELDLPVGDSRCMRCGGELVRVDKEAVKDRIPPRTYRWLNEYWMCSRCGQLFWHGTHWERVTKRLKDEE